jgi:tetratricopeptide (TPR) repeat protein
VALLAASGCGLTDEEESRLAFFRESALGAYDRGDYLQSLHQANMALELDEGDPIMGLVKGFCQLKLGKMANNPVVIDESLNTFEDVADELDDDFRVYLGLGGAHLARALLSDREIAQMERRLESEFLSPESRDAEMKRLTQERDLQHEHLVESERNLRRVLDFELQKENLYALVDLVLTLDAQGGRDDEAVLVADRALKVNDESTRFTQAALDNNKSLSPGARIDLARRIEANGDRERLLRDLVATVEFNRGNYDGFLAQMEILEQRGLLDEVQLHNRAEVREQLGQYDAAADDLQAMLRMRVRRLNYDQDTLAPEIFQRIEALKARHAESPGS